jgi:fatty-acid desaturase
MHHAYLDTDKDPHSPWSIGFWRSYFHLWSVTPQQVPNKFLRGLTRDKTLLWVHENSIVIMLVFHLVPILLFGWIGLAWGAAMILGVHAMGFTNAVNHWAGEPKKIRSTAMWWWQWGENCHERHHDKPRDYSFGPGLLDPTARILEVLERLRLVELNK